MSKTLSLTQLIMHIDDIDLEIQTYSECETSDYQELADDLSVPDRSKVVVAALLNAVSELLGEQKATEIVAGKLWQPACDALKQGKSVGEALRTSAAGIPELIRHPEFARGAAKAVVDMTEKFFSDEAEAGMTGGHIFPQMEDIGRQIEVYLRDE